jgi:hypothetical protein
MVLVSSAAIVVQAADAPTTAPFVASSAGPWIAKLPSGVTVELVAVSKHPVDAAGWWKPDGSPMTDPFPDGLLTERQYVVRDDAGERGYKFFVRYHTPDGQQRVLSPRFEDSDAQYIRRPVGKDYFLSEIVMPLPADAKGVAAMRVEAGLPGIERLIDTTTPREPGEWVVPETSGEKVSFKPGKDANMHPPMAPEAEKFIAVVDCPKDLLAHDYCRPVVVIKRKEVVTQVSQSREQPAPGIERLTFEMDAPAADVERFRFEVFRAHEYARFTNICLDPSEPTSPTAEGKKGDRWPKSIKAR